MRYIVALLLFVLTSGFFVVPRVLRINSIECSTQFGPCQGISEKLSEFEGHAYLQAKAETENYLNGEAEVTKFSIRLQLPGQLKVDVIKKKSEFALSGIHGQTALISGSGEVLSYQEDSLLPKLRVQNSTPSVGEFVDRKIDFALKLLSYANRLYGVNEAEYNDDFLSVVISGNTFVYPLEGSAKELFGATILIANEISRSSTRELNNGDFESRMKDSGELKGCTGCVVDLRYKNPVVKI